MRLWDTADEMRKEEDGTMNLRECYTALGGDYEGVVTRLGGERLVRRFVQKFLEDESYSLLCRSLERENHKDAFRAAHTLKGICQSLHFTQLYESSSSLSDMLRTGAWKPEVDVLVSQVGADYQRAVESIRQLEDGILPKAEVPDSRREGWT